MQRKSGILMPIFSLPSKYGIGTLGFEARKFADFLADAGQSFWQLLPLGPTGYGDSPYSSFSTFAGNPYFIDPETLISDGLLMPGEPDCIDWGDNARLVDYGKIYEHRYELLRLAFNRGFEKNAEAVSEFAEENAAWLSDYALFMAIKKHFGEKAWTEWPDEDIRLRKARALEKYRLLLREDIDFFTFIQFLFFRQWNDLREYVRSKGIKLIGDLPIYVALDSSDVWADPKSFLLDEHNLPTCVAGVPPDYFSVEGQLWGNPIYDWEQMKADGYGWWIRRLDGAKRLYDVVRIDHFRGFESYWSVPFGSPNAIKGEWKKGPGLRLINTLRCWFPDIEIIAEDMGYMTPDVVSLLEDSGFPGMRVLEFAFDSRDPNDSYLPHNYIRNCVCYIGTHDNDTVMNWFDSIPKADADYAAMYLGLNSEEGVNWGFIRGGMSSTADLFVIQMQDILALGAGHRTNTPGTNEGNWRWRMLHGEATAATAKRLFEMTRIYGRQSSPCALPESENAAQ